MKLEAQHGQQEFNKPFRGNDLLGIYKKMYLIRWAEEAILEFVVRKPCL